ncbi:thioesterase II family protein [Oscillatoria salina]|uniref:thioesterase II family protein n=1 Tax=Oscillatoria salina TaxID=331517 RepID=UPI0013B96564|nr:thioesterase II family protein [Oscillatoria salina]MBZ8179838.1 thioesterase [Oscillatoria salina IIICB1]NET88090.1 thioesterase [Kamptonema sp. SIO1D9]
MNTTSTFNNWVTCPKPNPQAKLRLFCFHYAGGSALSFRTWADRLPNYIEVCPVELPGRGIRLMEPPFTRLQPLLQALEKAILPSLNKPFAFFGHSMGAVLSFELAQLLAKNHHLSPVQLFVSGRRPPQIPDPDPPLHNLPEATFLKELRRYNGTPEEVLNNAELMELFLPTLRADFAVLETYVYTPKPRLNCPISAFGGWDDWKASASDLQAWEELTNADFSLEMFPGDHFFIYFSESSLLQSLVQKAIGD